MNKSEIWTSQMLIMHNNWLLTYIPSSSLTACKAGWNCEWVDQEDSSGSQPDDQGLPRVQRSFSDDEEEEDDGNEDLSAA